MKWRRYITLSMWRRLVIEHVQREYSTIIVDTQVSPTRENYVKELNILRYVSWNHMDHLWKRRDDIGWFWSMPDCVGIYQQRIQPSSGMLNTLCNFIGNKRRNIQIWSWMILWILGHKQRLSKQMFYNSGIG